MGIPSWFQQIILYTGALVIVCMGIMLAAGALAIALAVVKDCLGG